MSLCLIFCLFDKFYIPVSSLPAPHLSNKVYSTQICHLFSAPGEVEIFQTPNSYFKLSEVHSIATLRAQSALSACLWFLSRPNLRPSPWRILLLFTMWIICFISHHRCLCVLHSNIYKFFICGGGGCGRGLFNVQQRIPGSQIKHWAEFQRSWFNKWWEWRFGSRTTNPQLNKYPRSTCYKWFKDYLNILILLFSLRYKIALLSLPFHKVTPYFKVCFYDPSFFTIQQSSCSCSIRQFSQFSRNIAECLCRT